MEAGRDGGRKEVQKKGREGRRVGWRKARLEGGREV